MRRLLWLAVFLTACQSAEIKTTEHLAAGFRYSVYGPDYNPGPAYWRDVGQKMAARFPGSVPGTVWIVGRLKGQGTELSFPGRSDSPLIEFTAEDENEEALDLFDRAGYECWLQVEPGNAPVEELIHLMLDRYKHHPCVVGVGVDVEWYKSVDEPEGQAVTDAEAAAWLAAARSHNPKYRLFLKHWLIAKMPPTVRDGIFFIDDSQILPSLDAMVDEFAEWGRAFAPAPVGFQIGYESDRPWWKQLKDPPADIGRRILEKVPNTQGLYWVDFTVLEVFPGGSASSQPPGGLAPAQVPQFVQFGFDDNGISGREGSGTTGGLQFVTELFEGKRNPDGSPALFSLYAATRYIEAPETDKPEHVRAAWRAIADAGHEIGLHTHSHSHGTDFDKRQWTREIVACKRWLRRIGVSSGEIFGFRAPYLEYGPSLFPALLAQDVLYDCSVEVGFEDRYDGGNLPWPYRIDRELWEIPVYALTVPPDEECEKYGALPGLRARLHQVQDYFKPADGKITGFDWNLWMEFGMTRPEVVATFKHSLDLRLAGNRAPLTFGTHSDIYSEQYATAAGSTAEDRRQALAEILDYALSRPEVRVVTAKQILDWVRNPAPL